MSESAEPTEVDDRLPNGGRVTGPCEARRALEDVAAGAPIPTVGPCSGDPAERRPYPPAPAGEPPYFLCNAHLRDLFEALDRSRTPHH